MPQHYINITHFQNCIDRCLFKFTVRLTMAIHLGIMHTSKLFDNSIVEPEKNQLQFSNDITDIYNDIKPTFELDKAG